MFLNLAVCFSTIFLGSKALQESQVVWGVLGEHSPMELLPLLGGDRDNRL